MTGHAVTLGGWLAAAIALAVALWAWRARAARMEAVARACHELRGPITATRLGLQFEARTTDSSTDTLRALDLELGRASLALDDLSRIPAARGRVRALARSAVGARGFDRGEVGGGEVGGGEVGSGEFGRGQFGGGEFGGGEFGGAAFDLGALLEDVVEASRASATERGVALSLSRPAAVGLSALPCVPGDRLRIAQATRNLIENAIEHGGGHVEVAYRAVRAGVRIEVIDGGPGLPAPVADLTRRARSGRGLRGRGLAIAAGIAAEHGGRLASAPSEHGARLVLELPDGSSER